jgi:hypothetical protein
MRMRHLLYLLIVFYFQSYKTISEYFYFIIIKFCRCHCVVCARLLSRDRAFANIMYTSQLTLKCPFHGGPLKCTWLSAMTELSLAFSFFCNAAASPAHLPARPRARRRRCRLPFAHALPSLCAHARHHRRPPFTRAHLPVRVRRCPPTLRARSPTRAVASLAWKKKTSSWA